jgi:hypothetical protein
LPLSHAPMIFCNNTTRSGCALWIEHVTGSTEPDRTARRALEPDRTARRALEPDRTARRALRN